MLKLLMLRIRKNLFRLHFLKKLPKPFIFQLIQLLFSRFFCHKSTTFLLPSKTPIGGLYYQYSLLHIFDLLKKGWFSLPFLAIIALLLFLRNLTFLVFRTVPLSLYTVSGNGTIPIFPISAGEMASCGISAPVI